MAAEQFDSPQARGVLEAVCSVFKVPEKAMLSMSRSSSLSYLRRVTWQATRELYPYVSTTEIGRLFNRDHTTIVNALRWCEQNRDLLAGDVARVKKAVRK